MKSNVMIKGMGLALNSIVKKVIPNKDVLRSIKKEYQTIMDRAEDIGASNRLLSSYGLAAYFIAMNRKDELSPEENCRILDEGMRSSKLIKAVMGNSKSYFSEKSMESRRQWSKETHEKHYANDWVVDVLEKTDDYEFGFDYTECGVCKLCRDEGCPELAKYLCSLDFMLVEVIGIGLKRTTTLAEGGDRCDFRFSRLQ